MRQRGRGTSGGAREQLTAGGLACGRPRQTHPCRRRRARSSCPSCSWLGWCCAAQPSLSHGNPSSAGGARFQPAPERRTSIRTGPARTGCHRGWPSAGPRSLPFFWERGKGQLAARARSSALRASASERLGCYRRAQAGHALARSQPTRTRRRRGRARRRAVRAYSRGSPQGRCSVPRRRLMRRATPARAATCVPPSAGVRLAAAARGRGAQQRRQAVTELPGPPVVGTPAARRTGAPAVLRLRARRCSNPCARGRGAGRTRARVSRRGGTQPRVTAGTT